MTEKRRRTSVLLMYRAVSTDTGNYSCEPSNAESDTVQVHVLEGTGGLPRANVMANDSVKALCSNIFTIGILLLFAFNCQNYQIQV